MATSIERSPNSALRPFLVFLATSAFTTVMIAGAAVAAAPYVGVSYAAPRATSTPLSWAAVEISKPTYTPSPLPTFTPTSPPTSTAVPTQSASPAVQINPVVDASNLPAANPQDASQPNGTGKYIRVSISEQHLYAYENGQLVYSFIASTGMGNSTRIGNFSVLDKIPNAYGATWNIWMPDWLGIYYAGTLENGIHALPILPNGATLWAGYLGTPISFGCVVLDTNDAIQLYNWVDIGTPVEIRW
ncbi:MAG TPA: L,D-transpeptidase [Anaerolineales bacterium]